MSALNLRCESGDTFMGEFFVKDTMPPALLAKFEPDNREYVSLEEEELINQHLTEFPAELNNDRLLKDVFVNNTALNSISGLKPQDYFDSQLTGALAVIGRLITDGNYERLRLFVKTQDERFKGIVKDEYGVSVSNVLKPIVP